MTPLGFSVTCLQHIRKYLDEILKLVYDYWHQLMLPLSPRAGHASLQSNANTGNTSPVSTNILEFLSFRLSSHLYRLVYYVLFKCFFSRLSLLAQQCSCGVSVSRMFLQHVRINNIFFPPFFLGLSYVRLVFIFRNVLSDSCRASNF
jgi:hypothetical protein